jgi:pyridoxal 5-phosphate dependent beta-lyase
MSEPADRWRQWADRRPNATVLHLDTAAAGRMSVAVRRAVAEHLDREAQSGAYVAEGEAAGVVTEGRADLAGLLGLPADGVAFMESATTGLQVLLRTWPLPAGARVGVVASEWGPNLQEMRWHGLEPVELATEPDGRIDLDALARTLDTNPPALVHLTQAASHRPLIQPVAAAVAVCRAAGVPLWVDAAQALGQVDTATGADAIYATGRKWLAGPRGAGLLGVAEPWWDRLRIERPVLVAPDRPRMQWLDSHEASLAGRIGLCAAVREYLALDPRAVTERLAEVGRSTRAALAGLRDWTVVDAGDADGAITALEPAPGVDPVVSRARLLERHAILTTVSQPVRAPLEMSGPLLRVSPQVDCDDDALARLRTALDERAR